MIIFNPKLMNINQLIYTIGDCAAELASRPAESLSEATFQLERCYLKMDINEALEYVEDTFALTKIKAQNHKARVSA
jgi:hypothetical protein